MEDAPRINSLINALKYEKGLKANDALFELINDKSRLDEVTRIVLDRIDAGIYFMDDHLADLVIATNSNGLYERTKDRLLIDDRLAVKLYRNKIDFLTIEKLLCERLYKIAQKDGEPLRVKIVDAMAESGSSATLSLLNSFLYDMTPGANLHEMFNDSLNVLDQFKIRARSTFLKLVERAISQIQERVFHELPSEENDRDGNDERLPEPSHSLATDSVRDKAEQCIAIGLPDIALIVVRRGAEDMAKKAYRVTHNDNDNRDARKWMLNKLLNAIKEGAIPERLMKLLQIFQTFGNLAAHPQGEDDSEVSDDLARSMVVLYVHAAEVFRVWLDRRDGKSIA